MAEKINVFWFRQDLRLADNLALTSAANRGLVLPIYIFADENHDEFGSASKWWLHNSLMELNASLKDNLNIYKGRVKDVLLQIIKAHNVEAVYWNSWPTSQKLSDANIKEYLASLGVTAKPFTGNLLCQPDSILTAKGKPYRVYTPFYNKFRSLIEPTKPLAAPNKLALVRDKSNKTTIDSLSLLDEKKWSNKFAAHWQVGERHAQEKLRNFLENSLCGYKHNRDFPSKASVSRLSPYLRFGEISANQVWYMAEHYGIIHQLDADLNCFLRELVWREFSYYLLYHFPYIINENFQKQFDKFSWQDDQGLLKAWQRGQTGYPIIDAGMRELWQTGYMHNRVRMIVASFLTKNLLISWQKGAQWFLDCLLDADLANNSVNWQWVAGCGVDSAPYFRIFNPVTQGEKFDPLGNYIRHYVPELANLPNKFLFAPWHAPHELLKNCGIVLGQTYPNPIVDLATSRNRALASYRALKCW
jgi:deoxyribodipyrimidine photo-lyase